MKKSFLLVVILSTPAIFGMRLISRKEEVGAQRSVELTDQKTAGRLIIVPNEEILLVEFLPDHWYRGIISKGLVSDEKGELRLKLRIDEDLVPVLKKALYMMKMLERFSEYKATQEFYKDLKKTNFTLRQARDFIVELDCLQVSKPLISAMGRLFAELCDGKEPDLSHFSEKVRKEINRYFYLLNGRYIEGEPEGEVWLSDLLKFKKITLVDKVQNGDLNLSELSLNVVCKLSKPWEFMRSIDRIDLSKNKLKELPGDFGKGLRVLKRLFLQENDLEMVPDKFLCDSVQIERLFLNKNKLKELPGDFGKGWKALKVLHLDENELERVPEKFLCDSAQIERLFLNKLKRLPESFGKGRRALRVLVLNGNERERLRKNYLSALSQIEQLFLNKNKLKELPGDFGKGWRALKGLYLHGNALEVVPENFLPDSTQIGQLRLSKNKLKKLPEDFGKGWRALKGLYLQDNELASIPEKFLPDSALIVWLNLSKNKLKELSEDFGKGWRALKRLSLQENELERLPENFLEDSVELQELDLSGNRLTEIPEAVVRTLGKMLHLKKLILKNDKIRKQICQLDQRLGEIIDIEER